MISNLYMWFGTADGWSLGKIIIGLNFAHLIWIYTLWFFGRELYEVWTKSAYWCAFTLASTLFTCIAWFITALVIASVNFDGEYPFMEIYFTIMSIVLIIMGITKLTSIGNEVRNKVRGTDE